MPDPDSKSKLSTAEGERLLVLARQAIVATAGKGELPSPEAVPFLSRKQGVFVTITRAGQLRGCIGYPLPVKALGQAVIDAAVSAASDDPRFSPVEAKELGEISIEVSVLTPPREIVSLDVVVGRTGLILSQGSRRGLLLPQVAVEHGWDRDAFLTHTCYKAGLPADAWQKGARIEVFEAQIFGGP